MKRLSFFYWKNKNNILKIGIFTIVFVFLLGMGGYSYYLYVKKAAERKAPQQSIVSDSQAHELIEMNSSDDEIVQTFIADFEGIKAIKLYMDCKDDGVVEVILSDDSKNVEEWEISGDKIKKDSSVTLKLDTPLEDVEDKQFTIVLDYQSGEKTEVIANVEDAYTKGDCTYNNEARIGDICFSIVPCDRDYSVLSMYYFGIIAAMLMGFTIIYYLLWKDKQVKPEWLFVVFMCTYGIAYLLALPPFSAPDEMRHFATAYHISNELMGIEEDNESFPIVRQEDNTRILGAYPSAETYRYVADELSEYTDKTDNNAHFVIGDIIPGVPVVTHFFQAVGITIGRIVGFNYVSCIYCGQLAMLVMYTLMIFFAIKLIPVGKYMILALAQLPLSIQQTTSFSYDTVVLAYSFLFLAYALHFVYTKSKIGLREYIVFALLAIIFSPCKMVYCFITLLVVLIPNARFTKKWQAIGFKVLLPLVSLITALSVNASNISGTGSDNYIAWADEEGYTVGYLLTHIPRLIEILVNTYHDKLAFYTETLLGARLGWLEIIIPIDLIVGFVVVLVLAVTMEQDVRIKVGQRLLFIVIFVIISGLLAATMLLGWTPISYGYIEGLQGRYFIPILPLLLLCFTKHGKESSGRKKTIVLGSAMLNYLVVLRVVEFICSR